VPIAVTFATSPSHLFPVALDIAKQAAEFTETPSGKIKRYRASFAPTPQQAELAAALLAHLDSIKGVLVHAGGRLAIDQQAVVQTLGCFIAAQAGGGAEHYCSKSIEIHDPEAEHKHMFDLGYTAPPHCVVPCARLVALGFTPDVNPKKINTQIRAEAARAGCNWCPNFKPVK
jgi:hypothetical protein